MDRLGSVSSRVKNPASSWVLILMQKVGCFFSVEMGCMVHSQKTQCSQVPLMGIGRLHSLASSGTGLEFVGFA